MEQTIHQTTPTNTKTLLVIFRGISSIVFELPSLPYVDRQVKKMKPGHDRPGLISGGSHCKNKSRMANEIEAPNEGGYPRMKRLYFYCSDPRSSAFIRGLNGLSRSTERHQRRAGETSAVPVKSYMTVLFAVAVLAAAVGGVESARPVFWSVVSPDAPSFVSREDRIDRDLSTAAASALGSREGTVIVIDPRTGRVRTVVNPRLAFETAFAPGSTIKPFSTLATLRSGTIEKDSRLLCRDQYSHEDFKTVCSHPRSLPPLKPAEALAYSCNYYFGKLGEQLSDSTFNSTLAEFGFGQLTKINRIGVREAAGKLPHGQWRAKTALGEGDQIQVTAIQLLTAYSALVNGGHLLVPQIAPEAGYMAQHQTEVSIDGEHRQLILEGMRGAVRYGTAERARLHSLPLYVFGKTGTASPSGGFRTHGWFVGFASGVADGPPGKPETIELAILVFLKRAHGADAAEAARPIFESYIRSERREAGTRQLPGMQSLRLGHLAGQEGWFTPAWLAMEVGGGKPPFLTCEFRQPERFSKSAFRQRRDAFPISSSASPVRVHLVRENVTRAISLEDYILGVVAAEGSTEMEAEALKALAVASRTYAVRNLRRHAIDGYDFCTTTHCQRYVSMQGPRAGSQRGVPADTRFSSLQISAAISQSVRETAGQVLWDKYDRIVDSYFSASCGGVTANIGTLWGVNAPSYLLGGADEYCLTMPHNAWRDVISSANLQRALESDPRTKVGGGLIRVAVSRRDASGRAELITVDGARRRTVKGWDFKIIVGRALGWSLLKSSRFEISRAGSNYFFRGSGFGHGLGLCQEGAHVMARRGASYQQILAKYFPGTRLILPSRDSVSHKFLGDLLWNDHYRSVKDGDRTANNDRSSAPTRKTLFSEHFRLSYPVSLSQRDVEYVLKLLESNRADLIRRVSTQDVSFQLPTLEVFINESTGDFVGRTGQPPWVAAATLRNRIELQPFELLTRRRILETTIRHELVHAVIEAIAHGRAPRWLAEGLALQLAGEGPRVARYLRKTDIALSDLELRLSRSSPAEDMRADYAAAYREVKRLIDSEGESALWRRVSEIR